MKEYDISIIIPVYNCERYVRDCVKSILNQDYKDLDKIQVILVDDGSTDNSLKVCKKIQEEIKDFTIEIITGENEGVSSARNKGIKAAKGKYIMYIDADDFISKNAIRELTGFFDEHYNEIDLVTYPMYYYEKETKKKIKIGKYKLFKRNTDIYDLNGDDYYLIQTNMNVIVKNYFKDNILFDTDIRIHEDTKYDTDVLMKKGKIGYVKDVKYIYRKHQNQTTEIKNNPYYCYKDVVNFCEYYVNYYNNENGHIPKYVQAIIVNIFRWRIAQDKLFPYFLEKSQFDQFILRIKKILQNVDNEIIVNDRFMDKYHKLYLLRLKDAKLDIYTNKMDAFSINYEKDFLFMEDATEIMFDRIKVKNNKIYILAHLRSLLLYFEKPRVYVEYINSNKETEMIELELKDTNQDMHKTNIKVAKFYRFEHEIQLEDLKEFKYNIVFNDIKPKIKFHFNKWVPFNGQIGNFKVYDNNYRVQYKNCSFLISKPKRKTNQKDFIRSIKRYSKINKNINIYRTLAKLESRKKEKIWLYYDRKNVFDNAYSQFKHDIKIKDNIKKYYILDGKIEDYKDKFTNEELRNVIIFGSLKHKLLYLNSDKILTSFSSLPEYSPFAKNFQFYKDILKYDLIYLQHGILHAKLLKMYSKTFAPIDKFVISSKFERDNLINNYEYNEEDLIETGMPRLDDKKQITKAENKIIFAPSWREYLIGKAINRKRKINKQKFINSKYYIETIKFLKDKNLLNKLKQKNIILDYKLHPIFEKYKDCFDEVINENITVSIGGTDLTKYKAFITDFSSFQFDFVNLKRPIIYFVPDMKEFKAGLHTYRELDLKHEDAFGKLCLTGEELLNEIIKLIENDFKMDKIYEERMENFFYKVDNRKDKLYEELKKD